MVSPCGFKSDWLDVASIAEEVPDWTDCTDMSDAETDQLMVRRMQSAQREARDETRLAIAEFNRAYDDNRF